MPKIVLSSVVASSMVLGLRIGRGFALTLVLRIGVFTISLDIHSAAMVQGIIPDSFEKLVRPDTLDRHIY